jgi:hypothetical protein
MSWDVRSERINARGQADVDKARAEALRAQTARENRADERKDNAERQAEQDRRRKERQDKRAERGRALVDGVRRYGIPLGAIGSPEVIAWSGQLGFATTTMKLGFLAPLLPVALEGGVLYTARLALEAIDAGKPAGKYRAATWVQAGVAAGMNYWHGETPQVGVAFALTSLLGIVMLELTVALRKHKAGGRSAAEIRKALVRRLRYPVLSAQAAAIGAARGLDAEEAWRAAWVDRYGIGPDSTRRERRTARKILARQQRADRKAAKAGHLVIADGVIVRPDVTPAEERTDAERQAEAFGVLFGLDLSDEALAEWLQEPPSEGFTSSAPSPDMDGPQGASRALPNGSGEGLIRPGQIDADQRRSDDTTDGTRQVGSAAQARRDKGAATRRRVAAYLAEYPGDPTHEQVAEALTLRASTVKRARRNLSGGQA